MSSSKRFWFDEVGNNFRLPNPLAAILLAQLERFEELFRSRAKIVETYTSAFEGQEKFELQVPVESSTTSPWLFSFQVASKSVDARERLMNHLEGQGVETRPYFYPAHSMPPYQDFRLSPVFDSERLMDFSRRGLNLPTSSSMVPEQALWVANEALSWND
jgi:perosamine synthetase